ncbi:MAG: GH25 family lysozyme [Crocinitomicaceae bacterium]|jgi:lysozyme|nr:GH25 family lysozyme [Crocinitomicaceae bacterium]
MAKKRRTTRRKPKRKSSRNWGYGLLFTLIMAAIATGSYYFIFKNQKKNYRQKKEEILVHIPEGFNSMGIDVSHHQGSVDWELLFNKLGYDTIIRFVYCKATESLTHVDTKWEHNRKTLNGLGIMNGGYHFFDGKARPREQAAHFLAHWKPREIDLPPVLDVETEGFSDSDLIAKMKIWMTVVEEQTGYRPIIYTSLNYYETKFKDQFPGYYFWIAAYSQRPKALENDNVLHWQYSETGVLPGINEKVDLNVTKVSF